MEGKRKDPKPPMGGAVRAGVPAAAAMASRNPRRVSPENSVSLRPGLKGMSTGMEAPLYREAAQGQSLTMALRQQQKQQQPMKTSPSGSSASKWFDHVNENVQPRAENMMQDSPFFLGAQHSSSEEAEDAQHFGWATGQFGSKDSENSDLRDVIDDLTVENKELKQRLMKYERANNPELHKDKMFELRVHGLSASRRRDLEDMLSQFVSKVNNKSNKRTPQTTSSTNNSSSHLVSEESLARQQAAKSSMPSINADSAYASMTQSGQNSASRSGPTSNSTSSQSRLAPPKASKSRNDIKSYLHNIPESLLPKANPFLSERAKKKLVVQRLEHLFTGKLAAPGPHSQPLQQQEVSQMAAQEGSYKFEGSREARIYSKDKKSVEVPSPMRRKNSHSEASEDQVSLHSNERHATHGHISPDQRPTRPLDLDIHRAQNRTENMEYIRHLGLSSPLMRHGGGAEAGGWVYLNLLMSMAQLHTVNVTSEFIRKAITDMSDKFELSPDGRKVRWKGGDEGTAFSSDRGSNADTGSGGSPDESIASATNPSGAQSEDMASKKASKSSTDAHSSKPLPSQSTSGRLAPPSSEPQQSSSSYLYNKSGSAFDYKPIVFKHQRSHEESDDFMYPEYESQSLASQTRLDDATGQSSSNNVAHSEAQKSHHSGVSEGAIIFYRNAQFCTDLSGDQKAADRWREPVDAQNRPVLGLASDPRDEDEKDEEGDHKMFDGTPKKVPKLKLVPLSDVAESHSNFKDFPVSGLGGVVPDDNFLIDVRTRHLVKRNAKGVEKENEAPSAAHSTKSGAASKTYSVVSAQKMNLPPSRLPPPSFIFLPVQSSSSSSPDEDSDDELTASSVDEAMPAPAAMLNHFSSGSYDSDDDDDNDDDDDGNESSMDMLDAARAADPEAIAAREREYDLNNMEKLLPNDLPAGSSAATAGGGSGYASRASSPSSIGQEPPSLKRGRSTTGSFAAAQSQSRKSQRTD